MKNSQKKERSQKRIKKKVPPQQNLQEIQQQMQLMQTMSLMDRLKKKSYIRFHNQLIEFIRRNYVNSIDDCSMFKEQWEHKGQSGSQELEIKTYQSCSQIVLYLATIIIFSLTVWLANIDFFFGAGINPLISCAFYALPLALLLISFVQQGQLFHLMKLRQSLDKVVFASKPLGCCLYLIIKIANPQFCSSGYWLILQLPVLCYLYSKASTYYNSFRIMSLSKKYQYHLKTFDLIFIIIMMAHFIAIVVFLLTKIDPKQNWLTRLDVPDSPLDLYIYSFYFGCTTILTVGYGDIIPVNTVEVAVICAIELFGTAIFGYLVSQIGYNLSTLRKDQEIVEKDLAILQKCRQYYKIETPMLTKIKSNLLNSKQAVNRLRPDQQNQLHVKLNQPLRQDVIAHSKLSILKSSIFFLCRWSKHFQTNIAEVITSALYMPGEQVFQPLNKQRIYIVRLGQVDFYLKQRGTKRQAQKVIKTLKVTLDTEVTNNSFGYTAVIGSKQTQLEVTSRDFTSLYYVDKQKFMDSVKQTVIDWEYYHEVKDKINRCRLPEALEVPILNSRKFHYNPSRPYLIRRQKQLGISNRNNRNEYIRGIRRNKNKKIVKSLVLDELQKSQIEHVRHLYLDSLQNISLEEQAKQLPSFQSIQLNIESQVVESLLNLGYESITMVEPQNKFLFEEWAKHFDNFYPSQNLDKVLQRYDRELCVIKPRIERSQLKNSSKKSKYSRAV